MMWKTRIRLQEAIQHNSIQNIFEMQVASHPTLLRGWFLSGKDGQFMSLSTQQTQHSRFRNSENAFLKPFQVRYMHNFTLAKTCYNTLQVVIVYIKCHNLNRPPRRNAFLTSLLSIMFSNVCKTLNSDITHQEMDRRRSATGWLTYCDKLQFSKRGTKFCSRMCEIKSYFKKIRQQTERQRNLFRL
jgi:hypothetical protein